MLMAWASETRAACKGDTFAGERCVGRGGREGGVRDGEEASFEVSVAEVANGPGLAVMVVKVKAWGIRMGEKVGE